MADRNTRDVLDDLHARGEDLLSLDVVTLAGEGMVKQVIARKGREGLLRHARVAQRDPRQRRS